MFPSFWPFSPFWTQNDLYPFKKFYKHICEFKFDVILICLIKKRTNFQVCVCVHVYTHVAMYVFVCLWNNQVISLEYIDTKELSYYVEKEYKQSNERRQDEGISL